MTLVAQHGAQPLGGLARVEALKRQVAQFGSETGWNAGLAFAPAPDDVFIVTPPKCGTTWLQQIVHGLRTRGSMEFDEICSVIPYLERAEDYGYGDLRRDQGAQPRCFKSHLWYHDCPRGAKYIYVVRDPRDVAISWYKYHAGWFFDPSDISAEDHVKGFFLALDKPQKPKQFASVWQHIVSWYPHRNDPNVLWLHYDDLWEDLPECVRLIADFMGLGAGDAELLDIATKQASFEFMKQHANKFNDGPMKLACNAAVGLPANAGLDEGNPGKVRSGGLGNHKLHLTPHTQQLLQGRWEAEVKPVTGCGSFGELRQQVNKELRRRFRTRH
eukprot:evm.model.scf_1234.2 EVM.evm.TU.scf_1234.2   scf_1234:18061-21021(-)